MSIWFGCFLWIGWRFGELRKLEDLTRHSLALLVELRSYSRKRQECQNFQEFCYRDSNIHSYWNYREFQEWLNRGKVILLLDGLDEIFDPVQRQEAIADKINLSQVLPISPKISPCQS